MCSMLMQASSIGEFLLTRGVVDVLSQLRSLGWG